MPWTLEQLADSIRDRGQFTGSGIGFASCYMDTLSDALGKAGLAGHLKCSRDQLNQAIKSAGMKLVYRDPEANITAAAVKADGGTIAFQGKSKRPDGEFQQLKSTSLMEFENVLTTGKTDRDGDTLAPKGARVDPSAPLLWQHLPTEPIGKMFKVLGQDDEAVYTHCGIADVPLGRDAAVLVDYGALRISHGFKPIEFEPKGNKADGEDGWDIKLYDVMEVSLVSIPANTGAIITALEKGKLETALVKGYAGALQKGRTKALTGGWDAKAAQKNADADAAKAAGGVVVNVNIGDAIKSLTDTLKAELGGSRKDTQSNGDGTTDKPKQDDKDGEAPGDEGGDAEGAKAALKDVLQLVKELAKNGDLPAEAKQRAGIVLTQLTEVSGKLAETMKALTQAGKDMDIGAIAGAAAEMVAGCYASLVRAQDELGRVGEAGELPEAAAKALATASEGLGVITSALAELSGMKADDAPPADDDALPEGATTADDEAPAEDDAEPEEESDYNADVAPDDEEEEDEDGEFGTRSDDDEERSEKEDDDEERSEKDDDEAEEKAEDEDERSEKAEDEEVEEKGADDVDGGDANPAGEVNPDEENPEVAKRTEGFARKLLAGLVEGARVTTATLKALKLTVDLALRTGRAPAKKGQKKTWPHTVQYQGRTYYATGKTGTGLRGSRAGMPCAEYEDDDARRVWLDEDGTIAPD